MRQVTVQNPISKSPFHRTFSTLTRSVRERPLERERCELCGVNLDLEHDHLVEPKSRRLLCSCQACALLFCGQADTKYRRVPRDTRILTDFHITDAEWDGLMLPINMAFFLYNSTAGRIAAMYPSPAGPVESLLSLESWQDISRDHPALSTLQPDVEALLVNRMGEREGFATDEYYLAPIDQCYKLVGLLRMHWRGLSGGAEAWNAVREFFNDLRRRAKTIQENHHA